MTDAAASPLQKTVCDILLKQGYKPLMVGGGLYVKEGRSVTGAFMQVTRDGVRPYGVVPLPEKESHMAFVARNTRYLFK